MLHIQPQICVMDQKISIRVTKLKPTQHITIRCEVVEKNFVYDSHAHYVASLHGEVNLKDDPSFGGSYIGVDQMGIFWSMLPAEGQKLGLRYIPGNVTVPSNYHIQVYDGHIDCSPFAKSRTLLGDKKEPFIQDVVLRSCCAPGVTRQEVKHGRIRGTIFKPPGRGPFKGVIDVYGSAGGITESRAALLASHGFISFVLPHHRYQDLPTEFWDVEIEYFLEAVAYFKSLPYVQPGLGTVGLSSGATLVLLLSIICPEFMAVVSIASAYYLPFCLKYKGELYPDPTNIIVNPVPYPAPLDKRGGAILDINVYDDSVESVGIEIEKSNARFLLITGEDDKIGNASHCGQRFIRRMERNGKADNIQLLSYPGAGHFIDPPYMPQTLVHYNPLYKQACAVGGDVVENASACVHSWNEMLKFLNRYTGSRKLNARL